MKGLCISSIVLAVILANVNPSTGLTTKAKPIEPELEPDLPVLPDRSVPRCDLDAPTNGKIVPFSTLGVNSVTKTISPSAQVWYECDAGYRLQGTNWNRCRQDGTWKLPAPTCEYVPRCYLNAPKNGRSHIWGKPGNLFGFKKLFNQFMVSAAHGLPIGTRIWYTCNFGYEPQGSMENLCLPNGTWAQPVPTCEKVHTCDWNAPQYGKIDLFNAWVDNNYLAFHPGGKVWYECDAGYGLQGTKWNRCERDGTWERPVPTCEKGCGVSHVSYGRPSVYGLKVGQSVTWTCLFGFRLIGNANATCLENGNLSVAVPKCLRPPKKTAERRLATRSRETPQHAHEAPQETTATPPLATQSREAPRRAHEAPQETTATPPLATQSREAPRRAHEATHETTTTPPLATLSWEAPQWAHEAPHKTAERRLATRFQEAERRADEELAVLTEPSCTKCNFDADFARSAMCRSTVFVGKVNSESPTAYSFNVSRICKETGFDGLHRFHHDTSPRKQCVRAKPDKGKQQTYTVAKSTGRLADCSAPCGLFLEKNTEYLIGAVFNDDAVVTLDGGIAMKWGPARKYFKRKVVVDPQHCSTMAQDN